MAERGAGPDARVDWPSLLLFPGLITNDTVAPLLLGPIEGNIGVLDHGPKIIAVGKKTGHTEWKRFFTR